MLLLCLATYVSSYAQPLDEILQKAKSFIDAEQFAKADILLATYGQRHPHPHITQLHAQVLYTQKRTAEAASKYAEGIELFPGAYYLHLHYGRMLFQTGNLHAAEQQLQQYLAIDTTSVEGNIMLAYLLVWKGNVNKSKKICHRLLQSYPNNNDILALQSYLDLQYSSFVKGGYQYLSDDQPVTATLYNIEAAMPRSASLHPHIAATFFNYNTSSSVLKGGIVKAGNTFRFGYKTLFRTDAGIYMPHGKIFFIGSAGLTQKISSSVSVQVEGALLPYQFTVASLLQPFTYSQFSGAIQYNKKEKWLGKAAVEVQGFDDGSQVFTGYGWLLLPVVHKENFSLKTGYSFSYANATANTYRPAASHDQVIATQALYTTIAGRYQPVFTPKNQQVHAVLLNSNVALAKGWHLLVNGSVAAKASADNPVLILEKNNSNAFVINKYFYRQPYTPVEVSASLQAQVAPALSLQANYQYSSLFFYTRNSMNLQLNYRFIHARKN